MILPFPYDLRQSYGKRKLENNGKSKNGQLLLLPAKNRKATSFFLILEGSPWKVIEDIVLLRASPFSLTRSLFIVWETVCVI